jgi:hypothetical protein
MPFDQEVPDGTDAESFLRHLGDVHGHALRIKAEIEQVLQLSELAVTELDKHVADAVALQAAPVVRSLTTGIHAESRFVVVTGANTHLFKPSVGYASCRFHTHTHAAAVSSAARTQPITRSSVDLRSYFVDGSQLHCTHLAVEAVKRAEITDANRSRCGHRLGAPEGSAFCELWEFERMLCCRSCSLSSACTTAAAFNLPCAAGMVSTAPQPTAASEARH